MRLIQSCELFENPIYSIKPLDHELDLQNHLAGGKKKVKKETAFAIAVGSVGIVRILFFEKLKPG